MPRTDLGVEIADFLRENAPDTYDFLFGRMPNFRYYQRRGGAMFSWTTEPLEGQYASMVHVPRGKGARSGKAERWEMDERMTSLHDKRKDAKARALRLFLAHTDRGVSIADLAAGRY